MQVYEIVTLNELLRTRAGITWPRIVNGPKFQARTRRCKPDRARI